MKTNLNSYLKCKTCKDSKREPEIMKKTEEDSEDPWLEIRKRTEEEEEEKPCYERTKEEVSEEEEKPCYERTREEEEEDSEDPWLKFMKRTKEREEVDKDWCRYIQDAENSQNFMVGDYPNVNYSLICASIVTKTYDAKHENIEEDLFNNELLYLCKLAICFYNIRVGTYFGNVKVLMATQHGYSDQDLHLTFEAFSSKTQNNATTVPVTFQTMIIDAGPGSASYPKFQILFVRIKPPDRKSKRRRRHLDPSDFVHKPSHRAQIIQHHLSQLIQAYAIDSRLDSRHSLPLYLSQMALIRYNNTELRVSVAKHDFESVKVLKLVKSIAEVPTYLITFEAPLLADTEGKTVETFETEVCMPTLFPTTTIEIKSVTPVIADV